MKRTPQVCLLFGALILTGAGCSSGGSSTTYAQYWTAVKRSWQGTFGTVRVKKEEAAAIPYASMGYRVDDGPEHLIILATDSHGQRLWTSEDRIVLLTQGGQIVRTVGLRHDLGGTSFHGNLESVLPAAALHHDFSVTRYADFPDISAYSVPIVCHAQNTGSQSITILGQEIVAFRVKEKCHSQKLDWSFTDTYWVDGKSGLVWQSIQHTHPKSVIETDILRPPA